MQKLPLKSELISQYRSKLSHYDLFYKSASYFFLQHTKYFIQNVFWIIISETIFEKNSEKVDNITWKFEHSIYRVVLIVDLLYIFTLLQHKERVKPHDAVQFCVGAKCGGKLSLQFHRRPRVWPADSFRVVAHVHFTKQVPPHIPPEGLVPQAVHNGAQKPRQDLDNDIAGKAHGQVLFGQQVEQTLFKHGSHVSKHT